MNVHAPNHKSTVETPQRSDSLDTLRQWLSEGGKRKLTEEELVAVKYYFLKKKTIQFLILNIHMTLK